jgi:hypothetical protein
MQKGATTIGRQVITIAIGHLLQLHEFRHQAKVVAVLIETVQLREQRVSPQLGEVSRVTRGT